MKQLRDLALLLMLVSLASLSTVMAQAPIEVPLTLSDGTTAPSTLYFGMYSGANLCILGDTYPATTHTEAFLPPGGFYDVRIKWFRSGPDPTGCFQSGSNYDYRPLTAFSQRDTFRVGLTTDTGPLNWTVSVPAGLASTFAQLDVIEGTLAGVRQNLLTNPTVLVDGGTATLIFVTRYIPPVPGTFGVTPPASHDFGNVNIGSTSDHVFNVTNTGAGTLTISAIASNNAAFTILEGPTSVPPSGNTNYTVRFAPTLAGPASGTITFTHDGSNGPTGTVAVSGTGITPGPIFVASPTSFDFGSHNVPSSTMMNLTISNTGATNTLTLAFPGPTVPAGYTITPNPPGGFPMDIAPGGSHGFDVTFSPPSAGTFAGNIVFTHNGVAPGPISPTNIPVTGVGVDQGGVLNFKAPSRTHIENLLTYRDTLKMVYFGQPLKAFQLHILTHGLLTVQGVTRGSDIPVAGWNFASEIVRGPVQPDGSSNDIIKVVVYGNGSTALPPGTYGDLVRFRYGVVNITPLDTQYTTISLEQVHGSMSDGTDALVTAGPAQNVIVAPRFPGGLRLGDVNGDGTVDLLDLLMIVDHILNRITLTPAEFTRADIAPWLAGHFLPSPDGFVNVQDLALLQQIILTGEYPDGTPTERPIGVPPVVQSSIAKGSTLSPGMEVKLTFYITGEGVAVRMENIVPVKGLQLEFGSVPSVPANMNVTTLLGQGYFFNVDNLLRVLMYNQVSDVVAPGDRLVGNMPFTLVNPEAVTMDHYVVASATNTRIEKVEIEILHGPAPELPVDYMLFQNYPNPFNPSTSVTFSVPELMDVKVAVYNLLGQEMQVLFNEKMDRGTRSVVWNGRDNTGAVASSGMYIVRMNAGFFVQSRKMMFLK